MADVDIDPFGEHESRSEEPMGDNIPLISEEKGEPTWEPTRKQETSFGGESQRLRLLKTDVDRLYKKLSKHFQLTKKNIDYELFRYSDEDGELYCKGTNKSLTYNKGKLRMVGKLAEISGKEKLRQMGYDITYGFNISMEVRSTEQTGRRATFCI